MQISSNSTPYAGGQAQRLLEMLMQQQTQSAGQDMPGATDAALAPTAGPPGPQPTGGPNAVQMGSATLASLLTTQERPPSASDVATRIMEKADTNGDGSISLAEAETAVGTDTTSGTAVAGAQAAFAKLDTNGDGSLSVDELTSAIQGAHHGHHGHHAHAVASSLDVGKAVVSQADTNGDGVLSADEIAQALGQNASGSATTSTDAASALKAEIAKLDTSGDGKLSPAELAAGIDAFMAAHQSTQAGGTGTVSASA